MVIGDRIFEPISDENPKYRHDIELVLISRVFVTRAIESVTDSSSSSAVEAGGSSQMQQLADQAQKLNAVVTSLQAEAAAQGADAEKKRRLDEQQARLQSVMQTLGSGTPGAFASVRSAEGKRIVATQTFQRPVVIGYRAARYALSQ